MDSRFSMRNPATDEWPQYHHPLNTRAGTGITVVTQSELGGFQSSPTNTSAGSTLKSPPPPKEKLRRVSSRRKLPALCFIARYHVPSLMVTFSLLGIYIVDFIWFPGPSTDVLSALQFAAKVHEGLIILSLSNIILHRVRYLLMSEQGVPLGIITSPWQLSSPLYFLSSEFWGAAIRSVSQPSHLGTLLLVILCLGLSMAIGPFSAIILLPREGLWPVPHSYPHMAQFLANRSAAVDSDTGFRPYQYAIDPAEMYPTDIGPNLGISWECPPNPYFNNSFGCINMFNPGYDSIILQSLVQSGAAEIQWIVQGHYTEFISPEEPCAPLNLTTVHAWKCSNNAAYSVVERNESVNSIAVMTHPDALLEQTLIRDGANFFIHVDQSQSILNPGYEKDVIVKSSYSDAQGNPLPQKQDLVSTQCFSAIYNTTTFTSGTILPFARGIYPEFNITLSESLVEMVFNPSRPFNESFMAYFDIQPLVSTSLPLSVGTITSLAKYDEDTPGFPLKPNTRAVELCYTVAQWIKADIWTAYPYLIPSHSLVETAGSIESILNRTEFLPAKNVIKIDADWVNNLDIKPFNGYPLQDMLTHPVSSYGFLAGYCALDSGCMAIGVSAMLSATIGFSQCAFTPCFDQYEDGQYIDYTYAKKRTFEEAEASGRYVNVSMEYLIQASGYGFRSGYLVWIGFGVLLTHAAVAIVHILLIAFGGFWSSEAWASLGELMILALGSSPPVILRRGSGIGELKRSGGRWATWKMKVSVREKVSEDRLEMLLEGGASPVHVGHGGDLVLPRADKKYG